MFFRPRDRLLNDCRLFLWPSGRIHANMMGRDPAPTVTGSPVGSGLGTHPAVFYNGSTYATYGNINSYGNASHDLTIAFRARYGTLTAPGVSAVVACSRATYPADAGFAAYMGNNSGAGENAWTFVVHAPTGNDLKISDTVLAGSYLGKDVPVVMTYSHARRSVTLYVDGAKRATTLNTGAVWDPWGGANVLNVGSFQAGGSPFGGDISYLALFDRCFSDEEAFAFMRDATWSFMRDEDFLPNVSGATYRNQLGLAASLGVTVPGSPTVYRNSFAADLYVGGDVTAGPGGSGTATYRNRLGLRQADSFELPLLVRYANVLRLTGVYATSQTVTYRNKLGLRQGGRQTMDGRVDLLNTARYRR